MHEAFRYLPLVFILMLNQIKGNNITYKPKIPFFQQFPTPASGEVWELSLGTILRK